VRESILMIAQWLTKAYMGSHIEIRLARCEADLNRAKRSADTEEMMSELESIMRGGTPDCSDVTDCPHAEHAAIDGVIQDGR
jgi:hypothetical protein